MTGVPCGFDGDKRRYEIRGASNVLLWSYYPGAICK